MIPDFDPGIPELDPAWQATYFPHAWTKWGTVPRSARIEGGYFFYCDVPEKGERLERPMGCNR